MWKFRELSRGEIIQDPVQGEFFGPQEGFTAALVREAIQNSLDARLKEGGVAVRFTLGQLNSVHSLGGSPYFKDLIGHLSAQPNPHLPTEYEVVPFLSVEDFNTRGLVGSPEQDIDPSEEDQADGVKNDFYYFWRNIGRSAKQGDERGRWGLGKTVFPASSRINSFFGLTVQGTTDRRLCMGQCIAKIHTVAETRFNYYAYFAQFEEDGFQMPIEDSEFIDQFTSDFALKRSSSPGLSIVVPFPHEELTAENILREVVRSYYIPILLGDLTVSVTDGEQETLVDLHTLRSLAGAIDWSPVRMTTGDFERLLTFAENVIAFEPANLIDLNAPGANQSPNWNQTLFENLDVQDLRARFEGNELLAFRVPVVVKSGAWQENASFNAYLQRDPELRTSGGEFIRQGLTISHAGKAPKPGVRGIVLVRQPALSSLLGDSENPAHTEWRERTPILKQKYKNGPSTVRFVNSSLLALSELLLMPPVGRNEDLLVDLFFVETPPEDDAMDPDLLDEPGKDEDDTPSPPLIIEGRPQPVKLARIKGGFRITKNPRSSEPPGDFKLEVAYAVRRGNAFRKYQEFDFELGEKPISILATDASYKLGPNSLEVTPSSETFVLEVAGFDPNRDLEVRLRSVSL